MACRLPSPSWSRGHPSLYARIVTCLSLLVRAPRLYPARRHRPLSVSLLRRAASVGLSAPERTTDLTELARVIILSATPPIISHYFGA